MSLFYYSAQAKLSHELCIEFYNEVFWVFCAEEYKSNNPDSASPQKIYRDLLSISKKDDRLHSKFKDLKKGLKRGAQIKFTNGEITHLQHQKIKEKIRNARPVDVSPMLYIILKEKTESRLVTPRLTNPASREWIIPDLRNQEFEVIIF